MSFSDEYRDAVETSLAGRSAVRVATEAGLPRLAIETIMEGRDPGLSRAAEVAEALGLELRLVRKDEHFSLEAMQLAMAHALKLPVGGEKPTYPVPPGQTLESMIRGLAANVGVAYAYFSLAFRPWDCPDPKSRMESLSKLVRILEDSGVEHKNLPEAAMTAFVVARAGSFDLDDDADDDSGTGEEDG